MSLDADLLKEFETHERVRVIARLSDEPDHATAQKRARTYLDYEGISYTPFTVINAIGFMELTRKQAEALAVKPYVMAVRVSRVDAP